MELYGLNKTCSMAELGFVFESDIIDATAFRDKVNFLNSGKGQGYPSDSYFVPYAFIIYNTIFGKKERDIIKQSGFKFISRYKGDEGTVYTFMRRMPKPKP